MNEPTDYEEVDHEGQVLSRWDRLKQWFEIALATKKLYMFVMSIIIGTGGTAIYGEVTDTTPIRDVAEYAGMLPPATAMASLLARIDALEEADEQKTAALERLTGHHHNYPDPVAIVGKTGPRGPAGKDGKDASPGMIKDAMQQLLPKDHSALH